MAARALESPPPFIRLLAHDLRWNLVRALTQSDWRVQELVAQVQQPMNLVSYHLKKLRAGGLVNARRSDADGRDVYYALDLGRLKALHQAAGLALHPALAQDLQSMSPVEWPRLRVLFVCTHNSARSQMAEGLLRHLSARVAEVCSAGSQPQGVHPLAIVTMERLGIDIRSQRSRSLSDMELQQFDYVITVCDRARETCPVFAGPARQLHWSLPDPAATEDEAARADAFDWTADRLKERIEHFLLVIAGA